ncbi:hypothetical protein Tco_0010892 [Tanacetum coccineum]
MTVFTAAREAQAATDGKIATIPIGSNRDQGISYSKESVATNRVHKVLKLVNTSKLYIGGIILPNYRDRRSLQDLPGLNSRLAFVKEASCPRLRVKALLNTTFRTSSPNLLSYYYLWHVILNGDGHIQVTTDENGVETEVPPNTAQALLQRQRVRKAKSILLLAIPDEYQLRFHAVKDAKSLWAVIKSRFGGHIESKKMQKNHSNSHTTVYLEDLEQIDHDDLEEMDLKWQVAMLSIRKGPFCKGSRAQQEIKRKQNGRLHGIRSKGQTTRKECNQWRTSDALVVQDIVLIVMMGL